MNSKIKELIDALDNLSDNIIKSYGDDRTMSEIWGWNFPPLNRYDLASLADNLARKLHLIEIDELEKDFENELSEIPIRIQVFTNRNLQYLFNGNGHQATPTYLSLIEWITHKIEPLFDWEVLQDNNLLPNKLTRKLKSLQTEINEIIPNKEEINNQISLIKNATATAESLPTDLNSLKEAREKIANISKDAQIHFNDISKSHSQIEKVSIEINKKDDEAKKLIALCEEAYNITTTKGLAGAFDLKSANLSTTMWVWVFGLLVALVFGVYIGSIRFEELSDSMKNKVDVNYIWIQISLSVMSLGAPIWFAWVATKQITQRFKMSEDYAYKASLAKAYEGYRKEASKIDEDLEFRLFSLALTRLEEAPLRLVDSENYGSPWQEFMNSNQFKEAMKIVPDFKNKLFAIFKPSSKKDQSLNSKIETDNEEQ